MAAAPARPETTLEVEFRYEPRRFRLTERAGFSEVHVSGSSPETAPGRPDLPWIGERVEVPSGLRVVGVEAVSLETTLLSGSARLPSALRPQAGLGPLARTDPDPEHFSRPGFQPESPARLGYQGWQRGKNVAAIQVYPVRWDAASGRLEGITRMRVRLTLEPGLEPAIPRLRVVPEWEEGSRPVTGRGSRLSGEVLGGLPSRRAEPFRARQIPSVLGSPVAYVIITNDPMAPEFQRLADWKTQSGVPAVVRTLSFIKQEYLAGSDDAERMRLFIRDAYSRWGTVWVLLGGDTDVLPTRYARTTFIGGEDIACDMYFSCLDGNWNGDGDDLYGEGRLSQQNPGDESDLFPEVWVGRAPVTTVAQARQFVDKSLQYVRQPVGDYENRLLLFAEVLFPQNWNPGDSIVLDGARLAEDLLVTFRRNPVLRYTRLYENYTDPQWEPGALMESRRAVLDSLNAGYNVAIHIGHGYRNVMSVGDANIDNSDALALTNGNRLINLYSSNCTSNAIDFPSIGEAFLLALNGGAVTNIGSSRFDFPAVGRYFQEEYFRLVYIDSVNAVGEAQGRQKLPFIANSLYDGVTRWTVFTLLMLGDPELRLYTGVPRTLTVTHPASMPLSDSTISVNVSVAGSPLAGAKVVAYKPNDEYSIGFSNGAGNVVLPFRADGTGSFFLTVTGYDCRPYQATITLTPASPPALADLPLTLDDDEVGGTAGNGDGVLDAGETADLSIPVRNNGSSTALSVVGTLSSADPWVTVDFPSVSYGSIAPGATATPASPFRVSVSPLAPDQHEIAFQLLLTDALGRRWVEALQLTLQAPELRHFHHGVSDAGGNGNGRPDPGETVSYSVALRNLGTGHARQVTAKLRSLDGLATVTDSIAAWGDIGAGQEVFGDALVFVPSSTNARLQLRVSDFYGERWTQVLDLLPPDTPTSIVGHGRATSIRLTWAKSLAPDLMGYFVYRSASEVGPFNRINLVPTERVAYYLDDGLSPLTRYYYKVSAVDSSGNESDLTGVMPVTTTLPYHAIFPIPTGRNTPSSVAVDHLYPGYPVDIVVGSDVLYVWHPDGRAPVDADGAGATSGDFTTRGRYYAAGPSIADLDGDGVKEIIAPSWDSTGVYVFDLAGQVKPGWPLVTPDPIYSSAAIGDLDNDGSMELVFGSNGRQFYVMRADGTEWMDGDGNPATKGVFKVLGEPYNFGTPALADLDGNNELDIIYASFEGYLYAWRPDGSDLPGFPVYLKRRTTASVAVGYLDGPADTELDLVISTGRQEPPTNKDSVFVVRANGQIRPGWPVLIEGSGPARSPSPALADMNGDGFVDVVIAATNGRLYVFDRNGQPVPPFTGLRYSSLTASSSESSPVVADIDGDGRNDIVIGDENGSIIAFSGTGEVLPGFPIVVEAEVKGTPALCDCDADGLTEIVVAGWDKNVYMWDYSMPFSPRAVPPWPQFHHDAARTGLMTNPPFVEAGEPDRPTSLRALELGRPAPNPAGSEARIRYAVPAELAGGSLEVAVYDLSGRRVRLLERGVARAGSQSAAWNLSDASGARVDAGVYFIRVAVGPEHRSRKVVVLH